MKKASLTHLVNGATFVRKTRKPHEFVLMRALVDYENWLGEKTVRSLVNEPVNTPKNDTYMQFGAFDAWFSGHYGSFYRLYNHLIIDMFFCSIVCIVLGIPNTIKIMLSHLSLSTEPLFVEHVKSSKWVGICIVFVIRCYDTR